MVLLFDTNRWRSRVRAARLAALQIGGTASDPLYGMRLISLLLLPLLTLLIIGLILPVGQALLGTLLSGAGFGQPYRDIANDPTFWKILLRTLTTATIVAGVCLAIGYPTAEFINRASPKLQPILLGLVVVPLWSSAIARTYGWIAILQNNGVLDHISRALGGGSVDLLYTQTAVIAGMVNVQLPLALLPIYVAVRRYDERLSLASNSLGAGDLRTLLRVKLPVLAPQLGAAWIAVFVLALGFFVTPTVLGGPRSELVSTLIQQKLSLTLDLPSAEAMGIMLLVAALSALALLTSVLQLVARRQ